MGVLAMMMKNATPAGPPSPPATNLIVSLQAGVAQYQDNAGTTPALLNNATFRLWKDQSGNGNDYQNAPTWNNTSLTPQLKTNLLNTYPGVLQSQLNMRLVNAGNIGPYDAFNMFVVMRIDQWADFRGLLNFGTSGNTNNNTMQAAGVSPDIGEFHAGTSGYSTLDTHLTLSTYHTLQVGYDHANSVGFMAVDGNAHTNIFSRLDGLHSDFGGSQVFWVGDLSGSTSATTMYVVEMLVYSAYSSTNEANVLSYINTKFGI